MKAILIKENLSNFRGKANLYKLEVPLEGFEFVVVSATTVLGEPETYIFGANESGGIENWGELEGSFKGGLDHSKALRRAGYIVGQLVLRMK